MIDYLIPRWAWGLILEGVHENFSNEIHGKIYDTISKEFSKVISEGIHERFLETILGGIPKNAGSNS